MEMLPSTTISNPKRRVIPWETKLCEEVFAALDIDAVDDFEAAQHTWCLSHQSQSLHLHPSCPHPKQLFSVASRAGVEAEVEAEETTNHHASPQLHSSTPAVSSLSITSVSITIPSPPIPPPPLPPHHKREERGGWKTLLSIALSTGSFCGDVIIT